MFYLYPKIFHQNLHKKNLFINQNKFLWHLTLWCKEVLNCDKSKLIFKTELIYVMLRHVQEQKCRNFSLLSGTANPFNEQRHSNVIKGNLSFGKYTHLLKESHQLINIMLRRSSASFYIYLYSSQTITDILYALNKIRKIL